MDLQDFLRRENYHDIADSYINRNYYIIKCYKDCISLIETYNNLFDTGIKKFKFDEYQCFIYYNLIEKDIYDKIRDIEYIDIVTLKLNRVIQLDASEDIINQNTYDIVFCLKKNKDFFDTDEIGGQYQTIIKYNNQIMLLSEFKQYPGNDNIVEILVRELTNEKVFEILY